uniref:cell envelope biogenesis protein TolA n=1 Tax=uncultured Sphingomonas sp. TaxID=158754 RepID=UPI0035CA002A
MTRGEQYGLGLAVAGHVALFALLSLAWSSAPELPPVAKPIQVSLVDDVALDQHAPAAPEPPAQSTAPEPGPPADAPPPPKVEEVAPDPTPPRPVVQPRPAPPAPKPAPVASPKPAPPKPKPDAVPPPKPAPKPAAAPKKPIAEAAAKPAKASPAKAAPAKSAAPATKAVATTKAVGTGSNPKASKAKATGSLLDDDFRKGLTQSPSKSKAPDAAPGATMNAKAAADIGSAIQRQVQPCADRQINPGPGASRIVVTIRLSLNRDGTLAGRPTVSDDHGGVDDENRRYVDAVDRNAIATFAGCAPLRGLPPELYDVPRGWKTFILRYKLPG